MIGIEEIDEDIGSVASAAGGLDKSPSPSLQEPDENNKIHQTSTENVTNPNLYEESKDQESAGFTGFSLFLYKFSRFHGIFANNNALTFYILHRFSCD